MKRKLLLSGCFFVAILIFSKGALANNGGTDKASKSEILGTVFHNESRKPLRDVAVTAYAQNKKESRAVTDQQGNYAFSDLKPGVYRLVFERDGYRKVSREKVFIKINDGYQLNVGMDEENDFEWVPGIFNFSGGE